jgi:hypothetical protein
MAFTFPSSSTTCISFVLGWIQWFNGDGGVKGTGVVWHKSQLKPTNAQMYAKIGIVHSIISMQAPITRLLTYNSVLYQN